MSISTPALKHPTHFTETRKFVDNTGLYRQPAVIRISRLSSQLLYVDAETVLSDKVPDHQGDVRSKCRRAHPLYLHFVVSLQYLQAKTSTVYQISPRRLPSTLFPTHYSLLVVLSSGHGRSVTDF